MSRSANRLPASLLEPKQPLRHSTAGHCAKEGQQAHLDRNHPKPCCAGLIPDSDGRCVPDAPDCLAPGPFCDVSNVQDCCSQACLLTSGGVPVNQCF